MNLNRLRFLLEKHLKESLSPDEMEELILLSELIDNDSFIELWNSLHKENQIQDYVIPDVKQIKQKVWNKIERGRIRKQVRTNIFYYVAAVLVLLLTIALYIRVFHEKGVSQTDFIANDILIQLDSIPKLSINGNEYLASKDNYNILAGLGINLSDDKNTTINLSNIQDLKIDRIVISTPKGYTIKVNLPDGTAVWLNSNTSIYFDKNFDQATRSVHLIGEAFFDVKANEKPFIVKFERGQVKVLGTRFNVCAYVDYKKADVSLYSGKVEVSNNSEYLELSPGYHAELLNSNSSIYKSKIEDMEIADWRNGDFVFHEYTIEDILDMLKQWYDIEEVIYHDVKDIKLSGTIKQSKSLRRVLNHIEKISEQKFQIIGRRVIVKT